jgi:hypothetical protein
LVLALGSLKRADMARRHCLPRSGSRSSPCRDLAHGGGGSHFVGARQRRHHAAKPPPWSMPTLFL